MSSKSAAFIHVNPDLTDDSSDEELEIEEIDEKGDAAAVAQVRTKQLKRAQQQLPFRADLPLEI